MPAAKPDEDETSDPNKELLPEWTAARDVIAKIDDNLHDLRKYGFSFITGLFAVDALFATGNTYLPGTKPALIVGTMAMVVVLALVDRNYRVIQQGATIRATALERRSSAELTQVITKTYEMGRNRYAFMFAYMGLAGIAYIIGAFLLRGGDLATISIALVWAVILILVIEFALDQRPWIYLEIDGFTYKKGQSVLFVVTNLSKRGIELTGQVWAVYEEDDQEMGHPIHPELGLVTSPTSVMPYSDHRWQFPADFPPGLYRVIYKGPLYWGRRILGHVPIDYYPLVGGETDPRWKPWRIGESVWRNAPRFRVTG